MSRSKSDSGKQLKMQEIKNTSYPDTKFNMVIFDLLDLFNQAPTYEIEFREIV